MTTIDERVVRMTFQNSQFQQGVAATIASLEKLNKALKLDGVSAGLLQIAAVSRQLDDNMNRNRDSLGRFTQESDHAVVSSQRLSHTVGQSHTALSSYSQSAGTAATASQQLGQHAATSQTALSGFTQTAGTAATAAQHLEQNVGQARDALGHFTSGVGSQSGKAESSLQGIESGVQGITEKLQTMNIIGVASMVALAQSAIQAGKTMVKSFTIDPVLEGFREYETNINSVQTILANTQAAGTNLSDVTHTLDELNHYADQTIYNFAEMAKNIGTFTAAGVDLETSTAAIKGIANLAALSGSNSEQASGAMYQLSQAISAGKVSLEDWNSVVNAGMGGTVFQRALAQNAEKMGTLSKGAVELKGKMKNVSIEGKSFRESITAKPGETSWLTSDVLTRTLSQFTGDLKDADLAAQGFNKSEIMAIQAQAKTAKNAATEVKTLTQLMGTFREGITSGWAETWRIVFGDFTEAKGLFTGVSNSIGGMLQNSAKARNKMLTEWDKLGGRTALIDGVTNSAKALAALMKPIQQGFRQIFPATTGKQLYDLTVRFREFTEKLTIGSETADKLRRTFAGVFAVFGIVIDVVKAVVGAIFGLVKVAGEGSGGFLEFTAKIGDFLVGLRNSIREGNGFIDFIKKIGQILAIPIRLVLALAKGFGGLIGSIDAGGLAKKLASVFKPINGILDVIISGGDRVTDVVKNALSDFGPLFDTIKNFFSEIGDSLSNVFGGLDFGDVLSGANTGLFIGFLLMIKNFLGNFGAGGENAGLSGIVTSITGAFDSLTGALTGMQNALNAAALLQIAIAVGILALSMNTLSKIDAAGLARASGAITAMFAQLLGSLALFNKFIGTAGFAKLPFVMGSLILLAAAILILTSAVEKLSKLDWNQLAKGLTGVAVLLGLVVGALKFMPNPAGMISTGIGIAALAVGIKILASAVEDLSGMSWNELAKGLVGVGALLGALVLFTMFAKANAGGLQQGVGIILLAAGIKILASAVQDMSEMSWNEIAKGLVTLAGALAIITGSLMLIPPTAPAAALAVLGVSLSLGMIANALEKMAKMSWAEIGSSLTVMLGALTIIAAALYVIPPTAPLAAAGILIVALSLQLIAKTLAKFAAYSWEEIGKAMVMLAGTLGIIAGAMLLMTSALPGAAALLIVTASLAVLAPVLLAFGNMSWEQIVKGLLVLAGAFLVIGAAGLILAPVVPLIALLGAGIALLGIGVLAAGAGVFLFASALTALAVAGGAATAMIIGIVKGLIGLIPDLMASIGLGLVAFAKVIAVSGPAITKAIEVVLNSLIGAIGRLTPKIVMTLAKLMVMMVQTLAANVPKMADAGLKLLTGFLNAIARNLGKVITAATNVIVAFLNGIGKNLPRIIDAGVKLIISFVNGVAKAIDSHSAEMGAAGGRLAMAIVQGMAKGIMGGIGSITSAAKNLASQALSSAKSVLGINSPSKEFQKIGKYVVDGFRKGLDGNKGQIDAAFNSLKSQLASLVKSSSKDVDTLEAKLKKLGAGKKRNEVKKDLAQAKKEEAAAKRAYAVLTKNLDDEHSKLGKLATQYDVVTARIKAAQDTLANAIKTRDDYNKQIKDQYSDMPSATGETKLSDYLTDLKKQIEDTKVFSNAIQRLRMLGLNDEMYQDLLATGSSALPFVQELLAGGKGAVTEVNNLGKQLDTVGAALGKSASTALYQAGVDAAAGLVRGLQLQQKKLEHQMDVLANAMVRAIKAKLGIKSPSRAFMEIGGYSIQGMIKGMKNMTRAAEKSAGGVGTSAIDSMKKSLSGMSNLITNDINVSPTITPVLDLSSVRRDATQIGSMLSNRPISVDSSYSKAKYVASQMMSEQDPAVAASLSAKSGGVNYTQNNYSPKALSSADIYRQTKNQLSKAKGDSEP